MQLSAHLLVPRQLGRGQVPRLGILQESFLELGEDGLKLLKSSGLRHGGGCAWRFVYVCGRQCDRMNKAQEIAQDLCV
jgi:hypothetical protein